MKNAYFQLENRKEGTYLTIYPPVDGGLDCEPTEIAKYLDNLKFDYDKNVLYDLCQPSQDVKSGRIMLAQAGRVDEYVNVEFMNDYTVAVAKVYPATAEGRKMNREDFLYQLERRGIKAGIDEKEVDRFLSERNYCTQYTVANAIMPVEGSDAKIEYNFNTDLTKKPKHNDDGSVDFHQLDTLSLVEAEQVIATLTPAVNGQPGTDVLGRQIKPKKVSVKFLKQSKNTKISPDGCKLISKVNGHATLTGGEVFVSDIYTIPANVDASTGDINYDGNVEIAGNVNTGYKVRATGDIVVSGIVEGAELYADGQIILKRGIQGMSRGKLHAGTNIIAKFIESAEVSAKGFIQTESIMHSNVRAGSEIVVRGRKGFITGGSIKSGKYIEAKIAGSVMGTQTIIEVGENMALSDELKRLSAERQKLSGDIETATKITAFISKKIKAHEQVAPEKIVQFKQLAAAIQTQQQRINEIDARTEQISNLLSDFSNGYVLIDDVIYPGCRVTISSVTSFIHAETKHCRLMKDGADIRVKAY